MPFRNKINFLDISVYNRHIKSLADEKKSTWHSLGYLPHLPYHMTPTLIRFGDNYENGPDEFLFRYNFSDALRLYRLISSKKSAVALFHGFSFPLRFAMLRMLFGRKVKWIIQHHAGSPSTNIIKRALQKWAYSQADAYLFVSLEQAKPFEGAGILQAGKVTEIMECSTPFRIQSSDVKVKPALPQNKKIILWVGNLTSNKDPLCFLNALFKLEGDFVAYMFFGSSDLLDIVQKFIAENNLSEKVFLMGRIDNHHLENWYNAADIFVSCSHSEGSGIALAEAMACGCFPIITNIPSFRKMAGNGAAGLFFEPGNSDGLLDHLQKAMNQKPGRELVRKAFDEFSSFEAIAKNISQLAEKLAQ